MISFELFYETFLRWTFLDTVGRPPWGRYVMAVLMPYVQDKEISNEEDIDKAGKLFYARYVTK